MLWRPTHLLVEVGTVVALASQLITSQVCKARFAFAQQTILSSCTRYCCSAVALSMQLSLDHQDSYSAKHIGLRNIMALALIVADCVTDLLTMCMSTQSILSLYANH